jgi:hypothetical protein
VTCEDCDKARTAPLYRLYSPACLWCGARLINRLGSVLRPSSEITERRRRVLKDWMDHGHEELRLRTLAKGSDCFAPSGPVAPVVSERPRQVKHR